MKPILFPLVTILSSHPKPINLFLTTKKRFRTLYLIDENIDCSKINERCEYTEKTEQCNVFSLDTYS